MKYYDYEEKNLEKMTLKRIGEILNETGYEVNKLLLSDDFYVNNIMDLYETVELKSLEVFRQTLLNNNPQISSINLEKSKEEKINFHFTMDNLLLNKNTCITSVKRYILRYCFGDYEKEDEIFKNFSIEKIFTKKDIWDKNVFENKKFTEEIEKLKSLDEGNNKYLEKYFFSNIFKQSNNGFEIDEESESESSHSDDDDDKD